MAEITSKREKVQQKPERYPTDILLLIVDRLPLEDAVKTTCLARPWRNVWKHMTRIHLDSSSWKEVSRDDIVPYVTKVVSNHQGDEIRDFFVEFNTSDWNFEKQVNFWIKSVVQKRVQHLHLNCDVDDWCTKLDTTYSVSYKLDSCIFNCTSLVSLELTFCRLELPDSMNLPNLQKVNLRYMEITRWILESLTSNAPALQELVLECCNKLHHLDVLISPNSKLQRLIFKEDILGIDGETKMKIDASNIVPEIVFLQGIPRKRYRIENVLNCKKLVLNLDAMLDKRNTELGEELLQPITYERHLFNLLAHFNHVEALELCNWSIQLISKMKMRTFATLDFQCTNLKLHTGVRKWELPGIAYMLKSCSCLENLHLIIPPMDKQLMVHDFSKGLNFVETKYWRKIKIQTKHHFENLKFVEYEQSAPDFQRSGLGSSDLAHFFDGNISAVELLKFLNNNARNLALYVFSTTKKRHQVARENFEMFLTRYEEVGGLEPSTSQLH